MYFLQSTVNCLVRDLPTALELCLLNCKTSCSTERWYSTSNSGSYVGLARVVRVWRQAKRSHNSFLCVWTVKTVCESRSTSDNDISADLCLLLCVIGGFLPHTYWNKQFTLNSVSRFLLFR